MQNRTEGLLEYHEAQFEQRDAYLQLGHRKGTIQAYQKEDDQNGDERFA